MAIIIGDADGAGNILSGSGNTQIGNTIDDIHTVTGSLYVSGTMSIHEGTLFVTGTERATGRVGIGTTTPDGFVNIKRTTVNALTDVGDPTNYHLQIQGSTTNDSGVGICLSSTDDNVGAAIIYKDVGSNAQGELQFYTKASTTTEVNPIQAMVISADQHVGIGTTRPQSRLHLEHTDTTAWPLGGTSNETYSDFLLTLRNNTDTIDAFAGIAFDISTETDSDSIGAAIVAQCADSTSTQHDTDLIFATNQISDDDLSERMRITHDGRIGFGTPDPEDTIDATFAFKATQGDSYCLKLHNDGDSNSRRGLYIACGSDDSLGTNYAVAFADGNDSWQGSIKFTGGTTSYMAFTAAHPAEIPEGHSYTYGTVVCVVSTASNNRSIIYNVTKSTSAMQASVIGCYSDDNGGVEGPPARHSVNAVGDGHILVCSEGGDIVIGDYICSSNTAGHGMQQSSGAMMNYTVAKAYESVDWSSESSSTKLIACTYLAG